MPSRGWALMRRREFLSILGGTAVWPVASKAQQAERVRRVGILTILGPDDPEGQARTKVFEQTLQQLGWTIGRDLKIETRQIGADLDSLRRYAAELVALAPDVIFSIGSVTVASLQQATRTIPIERYRSGWCWYRRKYGPPRRQYHRLLEFRVQHVRQMGRVAQANRAQHDPSPGVS